MSRIRTIKPEFWKHPVYGRLDYEVRMMAVALLSMADDEGYFLADPAIVRGEVDPYQKDLMKVSRILMRLSEVGWIELFEHPEQGKLGKITNWTKHQRVQHPSPSKIKSYCSHESFMNPHEEFSKPHESFTPDQGSGNREQGTGNRDQGCDTPSLPSPPNEEHRECSLLLKDRILERRQQKITDKTLSDWDDDVKRMIKLDGRTLEDIKKLIKECHDMPPTGPKGFTWRDNILSMSKLRDKWNEGKIYVGMTKCSNESLLSTAPMSWKPLTRPVAVGE